MVIYIHFDVDVKQRSATKCFHIKSFKKQISDIPTWNATKTMINHQSYNPWLWLIGTIEVRSPWLGGDFKAMIQSRNGTRFSGSLFRKTFLLVLVSELQRLLLWRSTVALCFLPLPLPSSLYSPPGPDLCLRFRPGSCCAFLMAVINIYGLPSEAAIW